MLILTFHVIEGKAIGKVITASAKNFTENSVFKKYYPMYNKSGEGVAAMCKIMEDMRNEAAMEAAQKAELKSARETAERMIRKGRISLEEIADYVPSLSFNELKKIEAEVIRLA